ncbi:MAG: hypothetical protein DRP74_02725 [Candidatus Omnitrophota bacterium]|nr:MAG: hypothetical protein DRP74_02725 [Candidatus Omnitrophota bacterium]
MAAPYFNDEDKMRKIISLIILVFFCFVSLVFASDAQRMVSSDLKTSDTAIKTSAGKIYKVSMLATSAQGWVAVYDSSSSAVSGKTVLIELQEATQYCSTEIDFSEGLNAREGIYLEQNGASAIVYYY